VKHQYPGVFGEEHLILKDKRMKHEIQNCNSKSNVGQMTNRMDTPSLTGESFMAPYDFEKMCRAQISANPRASFLHVLLLLTCSVRGHEWQDAPAIAKSIDLRDNYCLELDKIKPSMNLGFVETRKIDNSKGRTKHQLRITEQVDLVPIESNDGMKMQRMHHDLVIMTRSPRTMITPLVGLILVAIHLRGLRLTKDINEYIGGDVTLWQVRLKIMQKMEVAGLLHIRKLERGAKPKLLVAPVNYL
jgi:hypothetical protein